MKWAHLSISTDEEDCDGLAHRETLGLQVVATDAPPSVLGWDSRSALHHDQEPDQQGCGPGLVVEQVVAGGVA
jgi:hypothetical protein